MCTLAPCFIWPWRGGGKATPAPFANCLQMGARPATECAPCGFPMSCILFEGAECLGSYMGPCRKSGCFPPCQCMAAGGPSVGVIVGKRPWRAECGQYGGPG